MIVSIHQPDFFPWLGLFNKIANSDRFVVFDNVLSPRGKSWLTRNRIVLDGQPRWLTLPVKKGSHVYIQDLEISEDETFKRKHLGTIKQAYQKTPYYSVVFPVIEEIYNFETRFATQFNINALSRILDILNIKVDIVYASQILPLDEAGSFKGNDMVLELARRASAAIYLSGTGCTDFILPDTFEQHSIEFRFQNYAHPEYQQLGSDKEFLSHMSILDSLFNAGPEETSRFIKRAFS